MSKLNALIGRRRPDPRTQHAEIVAKSFSDLPQTVVDAAFENFGYTLTLSFVQLLTRLCGLRKPQFVVEAGCGISTLALSAAIAPHDGLLVSLEQDVAWIARTSARLDAPESVLFIAVPPRADGTAFDHAAVLQLGSGWAADLVLVDGPANNRFGDDALELYRTILAPGGILAIDDTDREENAEAATSLGRDLGLKRMDFSDPIFTGHQYTLLVPPDCELPASAAIPV